MIKKLILLTIAIALTKQDMCTGFCSLVIRFRPVCGMDGITYRSACHLHWCGATKIAYDGICSHCETCDQYDFDPVCASDNNTYKHSCAALCAGKTVVHKGVCYSQCNCNQGINYVCGVNGKTYENDCIANCYGIQTSHKGECYN